MGVRISGQCTGSPSGIRQSRSHTPGIVKEVDHVLRNRSKTRVKWSRANLDEHVAHVLDQDKLCLVTRGFEVPIELHGLRLEDCRVVDALNKKDGWRVRDNEMCGAGKKQVPAIALAEDLLNAGGRKPPMLAR